MSDGTFNNDRREAKLSELLSKEGKRTGEIEMVGYSGKIPKWKTVDFYMTSKNTAEKMSWRSITDDSGKLLSSVNSNVLLIPEDSSLAVNGSMEVSGDKGDSGAGGKGLTNILDYMQEASSVFTDTVVVPEYNMPTFKDIKGFSLPNTMKFNFRYGNAGLYSGFEEVVKPIIALLGFFAPETKTVGSVVSVRTPWPTRSKAMYGKIVSLINKDVVSNVVSSLKSAEGLGESISSVNASIQSALNSAAKEYSYSPEWNNIFISYGRLTLGPMIYKEYKYTFSMDQLDENGWPISGSFEIGGMESTRKATKQALLSTFVRG